MKEAMFYKKEGEKKKNSVSCYLCNRRCFIPEGRRGFCRVRENKEGKLYSLVYGKAVAAFMDPIEKKPLNHFHPGSRVFSIATVGCNFRCLYCQNPYISQEWSEITGEDMLPKEVVKNAEKNRADGIAYTYTEPTIFFEYAYDTAKIAKKKGMYNVFVTNGYMTKECIKKMKGIIDASNVDLKAFTEKFYKELCGDVLLEHVLESIKELHKIQHIEVTNLLIPGYNDSEDEIRALSQWVKDLDKSIPLHFTAFFPAYKMTDVPPTPTETVKKARKIALDIGMEYVYAGNILDVEGNNTYCPNCGEMVIKRFGFSSESKLVKGDKCPSCGHKIKIIQKKTTQKKKQ